MKLDFCAICGKKTDLHQHHIEPVVFSGISRGRTKGYNGDKPLKDCTSMEVFRWLFNQGIITDDGEITVCSYHHDIMHGIVKFQKAEHTTLIKTGIARAKANGIKCGRPSNVNDSVRTAVRLLREQGKPIRQIARTLSIGVGTTYSILSSEISI